MSEPRRPGDAAGTPDLGALGVWTSLDGMPARDAGAFARRVEELGYRALWIPEAVGRDPFAFLGWLAAATERLVLATGIANVYARDAMTTRAARETLAELSGGRDPDFADGGSDRLVDAIVAWGDEEALARRVRAHRDAGANHVCIQPLRPDGELGPDVTLLEALAPGRPA